MKKIKVGIIGIGFMGSTHFHIHKNNKYSEVVAICDVNKKKQNGDWTEIVGNLGGDEFDNTKVSLKGVKSYAKYMDLINDPEVEYVDICVPTFLHKEIALAALKAGKHVQCEKPMATNSKDAKAMVDAAKKTKKFLMIGHCIRFWPEYAYTQELISKNKYGKVLAAHFNRASVFPKYATKNWYSEQKQSGGAALDLHIHDVDYSNWLFGMPQSVCSSGFYGHSMKDANVQVSTIAKNKNVQNLTIHGDLGQWEGFPFDMSFKITCEKATISFDHNGFVIYEKAQYPAKAKVKKPKVAATTGWHKEIEYYTQCVINNKKPTICTPIDALNVIKVIESEYKSMKSGKIETVKK